MRLKKELFKNFKELLEKMEKANPRDEAIEFVKSHHPHFAEEIRSGLESTNAQEDLHPTHYTPPFPEHISIHRHKNEKIYLQNLHKIIEKCRRGFFRADQKTIFARLTLSQIEFGLIFIITAIYFVKKYVYDGHNTGKKLQKKS